MAAVIQPAPGQTVTGEELTSYCRDQLAAHKIPRRWRFEDTFPLTASGKVQKFVLRTALAEAIRQDGAHGSSGAAS